MDYFEGRSRVLCFSHDWSLLITRQWLLERLGSAVISVMSHREFQTKVTTLNPNLIILCQTLSDTECEDAIAFADTYSPASRCLVLCGKSNATLEDRHTRMRLDLLAGGPPMFVSTVQRMLTRLS